MNKKKQSARITDLKAENYDLRKENHGLRFENEFLKNRIIIMENQPMVMNIVAEKKAVELVKGKWYFYKDAWFRYSHMKDTKVFCFSMIQNDHLKVQNGLDYFYLGDDAVPCDATTEQIKKGITLERENGYFWNDEKQDFLKLEDVYFEAQTRQDLLDIASIAGAEVISNDFDIRISYPFVQMIDSSFICNSLIASKGKIEVTKEVFIKLLKNYKG